jgi:hypothetical protein
MINKVGTGSDLCGEEARSGAFNPLDTYSVPSWEQTICNSNIRQLGFGRSAVVDKLRLFSKGTCVRHCYLM